MTELVKIAASRADEVAARYVLADDLDPVLAAAPVPAAFLDKLLAAQRWTDAVRFLAHALPRREAVWWACVAARWVAPASPSTRVERGNAAALTAAEAWVFKATEENRKAAETAVAGLPLTEAGVLAALAVCVGNAAALPDGAELPPPGLYGVPVAEAVGLAARVGMPPEWDGRFRRLLDQGLDIARGGDGRASEAKA